MSDVSKFLDSVITRALAELRADSFPLYTFAIYHDHESRAVSICADTKESSERCAKKSNEWTMNYFAEHIQNGDLESALLFQANPGRSFSIGDFAKVNVARTDIDRSVVIDSAFYLALARSVIVRHREILMLAPVPDDLFFCSSTEESEVGLVWTALGNGFEKVK